MTRKHIGIGLIVLGVVALLDNFGVLSSFPAVAGPLSVIDVNTYLPSSLVQNNQGIPTAFIVGAGLTGVGIFLTL